MHFRALQRKKENGFKEAIVYTYNILKNHLSLQFEK
jgi:hypothetical protein